VKIRTRLFIAFLILVGLGFYKLVDWIIDDLRPRYLETMEESMIDAATILSSFVEQEVKAGKIGVGNLRAAFDAGQRKRFSAKIYQVTKTRLNMRVYVTDSEGIVIFDSENGRDEGRDYSRWNDVIRTMRGEYGARTTPSNPDDFTTSVLYVSSPVKADDRIVGVLTVCKPADSVTLFLQAAKRKIAFAGIVAALAVAILGMIVSSWITWPIQKLTAHARAIRDGRRIPAPKLGRSEIGELGNAFEEMRDALEGKQYVENYVQTLTHEMKSPVSAIRGAAELLEEEMPAEQRRQFLDNIRAESGRIQDLVDRLLELSALEKRKGLRDIEEIDVAALIREAVESLNPVLSAKRLTVKVRHDHSDPKMIEGERFLIRQAVANLLQNAVDFSPAGSEIDVSIEQRDERIEIAVSDSGPGVPGYALGKVFERFYSLRRPDTGKKGSGLGLTFVREVASLHGGEARLENPPDGGVKAILALPLVPAGRMS